MTLPVAQVVRGLNAAQPELLMGYPSALDLVVREAQAGRLKISPRFVEAGGELLMERTRQAVRELWGVEIDDAWAVVEGAYAFACPDGQGMHLPDDLVIIEPVDLDGRPVPPGEPAAKLYLTNLYNRTQPLIRFEIADGLTVLDGVCACGSAHRRIVDLTGRADIVFSYDDDVKIHPMILRLELHDERYLTEYQIRQTARGVCVKVVTEHPEGIDQIRDRLVRTLRTAGLRDPEVTWWWSTAWRGWPPASSGSSSPAWAGDARPLVWPRDSTTERPGRQLSPVARWAFRVVPGEPALRIGQGAEIGARERACLARAAVAVLAPGAAARLVQPRKAVQRVMAAVASAPDWGMGRPDSISAGRQVNESMWLPGDGDQQ